jgi:predicted nucleotidyltransferase
MGIDQQLIDDIVRRVLSVAAPDRIILFGSAAGGQMTPDSDVDLMILETAPSDPRAERAAIRHALFGLGRAFDLIVMPTEKFESSKHVIGTAAWPATQSGKVIYDAA